MNTFKTMQYSVKMFQTSTFQMSSKLSFQNMDTAI